MNGAERLRWEAMAANEFPPRPVPAVGAIVFRNSEVLLVRRGAPPNRGLWSVPGGAVEIGETVEQAAVRETHEETGVDVRPMVGRWVTDSIERETLRREGEFAIGYGFSDQVFLVRKADVAAPIYRHSRVSPARSHSTRTATCLTGPW